GDLGGAAGDEGVIVPDDLAQLRRRESRPGIDLEVGLLAQPRKPLGTERVAQEDAIGHGAVILSGAAGPRRGSPRRPRRPGRARPARRSAAAPARAPRAR